MSTTAPPRGPGSSRTARATAALRGHGSPTWLQRLESPTTTYYLLIIALTVLVTFGLIMVMSASAVVSLAATQSAYSVFRNQLIYAALGVVVVLVAMRLPPHVWKRLALPVMGVAIASQALVFSPVGVCVQGNCNWIEVAGFRAQPSEVVKLALALLGAAVLTKKRHLLGQFRHVLVPYIVPFVVVSVGLVLYGEDLGTVLILGAIVGAVLWTAGVRARYFAFAGGLFAAMAAAMVVYSPNRLGRLDVWLGRDTDPFGSARQTIHGRYALADGGWIGVGLGRSREKWQWLPEPHNDFIFAIIGEELGLVGTLLVVGLFVMLGWGLLRVSLRAKDPLMRITSMAVFMWVIGQAAVNISVVIQLLPVIGVPLPYVSYGGSALVANLIAAGLILAFARQEPGAADALAWRRGRRRPLPILARRSGGRS